MAHSSKLFPLQIALKRDQGKLRWAISKAGRPLYLYRCSGIRLLKWSFYGWILCRHSGQQISPVYNKVKNRAQERQAGLYSLG